MKFSSVSNDFSKAKCYIDNLFILIILLTYGLTNNLITILACVYIILSFFKKSYTRIICDLAFFYPFYNLFKFNGQGISLFNFIIFSVIIFSVISLNYKDRLKKLSLSKLVIFFILLIYCLIIPFLNNNLKNIQIVFFDFYIQVIALLVIISNSKEIKPEYPIYLFAISLIISSVCSLNVDNIKNLDLYIDSVYYRFSWIRLNRLQGLQVNPNYFSVDLNFSISTLLVLPKLNNRGIKLIEIVLVCLLTVFGLMTLSKSFIICFLIIILFYIILIFSKGKLNMKNFLQVMFIILVFIGIFIVSSSYLEAILSRLITSSGSIDDLTSSRYSIWIDYLKLINQYPIQIIFGHGLNSNNQILSQVFSKASHSLYLESLLLLGFLGSTIYIFFIIKLIKISKRRDLMLYLPLIVILIRGFAINLSLRESMLLYLVFILIILNNEKRGLGSESIA